MIPRLKELYNKEIQIDLKNKLGLKNSHMAPKLVKVILNMGLGVDGNDSKILKVCEEDLSKITGQKPANKLVVYDGNLNAKVMLIGEAPGRDEDQQGIPFVGRAGQLLNKMLMAINLQREDVYITNVVNWRPPDNRTPNDNEILEFLPFLQRQIDIIKPKFIFLLGGVAAKAILSTPLALGKLRGKWHEYKSLNLEVSIPTIASYHPAFLLRSPNYKKHSWEDLQMLQEKLKNES